MSAEVTFNDVSRVEIDRHVGATGNKWVDLRLIDITGKEIAEIHCFAHRDNPFPNVTSNFRIAITRQGE